MYATLVLFAFFASRRRWVSAACRLGLLVAARPTMVAIVPVFLMGVWSADRERFPAVLIALAITTTLAVAPFVAWDPHGMTAILNGTLLTETAIPAGWQGSK